MSADFNKMNTSSPTQDPKSKAPVMDGHFDTLGASASRKAQDVASSFADRASDQYQNGRDYVIDNPVKGVAIAAAAGVVVGSLLTAAMRRNN